MSIDQEPVQLPEVLVNILDKLPYSVQIYAYDGLLLYVNSSWEAMWHASADTVVGKFNPFEVDRFEDMGVREFLLKTREGGLVQFPDWEFDPANFGQPGRKRWVRSHSFLLELDSTEKPVIVIFNLDIGDQIDIEHQLTQNIEKLKEAQHLLVLRERLGAIGQLASGIAHDFNNILAIILLEAQLVSRSQSLDAGIKKRIEAIIDQSERGARLIRQILDFSRSSISRKEPIEINKWLEDFITLARRTLPTTIEIHSDLLSETLFIDANDTQLHQVFMNLIINARDAIEGDGTLSFSLHFEDDVPAKYAKMTHQKMSQGYAVIKVIDTGGGIQKEHIENIFDPFFTTKSSIGGSGLGLSQAYGIVKQHYGFIDCISEVGIGTTFALYFPTVESTLELSAPVGSTPQFEQEELKTILLVEDRPITRQSIQDVLELLNYRVITAVNGVDALKKLEKHSEEIDLVLSDIVMPKMGGALLRENVEALYPQMKIILMTGFVSRESEIVQELIQDAIVIEKPFSIDFIKNTLQTELSK